MEHVDWPDLGHMAQGLGWIHLTCHWERDGSSRKLQILLPKEGRRTAGWAQALMAFPKGPRVSTLWPYLLSASSGPLCNSQFLLCPFLSFFWAFCPCYILAPLLLKSDVSSKASVPQSSLPFSGLLCLFLHGLPWCACFISLTFPPTGLGVRVVCR